MLHAITARVRDPIWWAHITDTRWWRFKVDRWRTKTFFLPEGYQERYRPDYFEDATEITYQPDVYPYAAELAAKLGCTTLIDIGCGSALKLAGLQKVHPEWTYIGVDYGKNIAWCRAHHQFGTWLEADLEGSTSLTPYAKGALVICSDVIEHVVNPMPLLQTIHGILEQGGKGFVLSTPDRERKHGLGHNGPPLVTAHVREWSLKELTQLLAFAGFTVTQAEFTRSNDADPDLHTVLIAGTVK